jgi:ribosomal protein S18 acetylase RimI-like enzyme
MLKLEDEQTEARGTVRNDLRAGDIGAITRLHGVLYAAEYGLDARFEAGVAETLVAAVESGWPERGAIRIAEQDGRFAGSVGLTIEGPQHGRVRWVLVDPALRGRGIGRRMVTEVVELADASGLELVDLWTFSELRAAGQLYRSLGFEIVETRRFSGWGRPILMQHYERRERA